MRRKTLWLYAECIYLLLMVIWYLGTIVIMIAQPKSRLVPIFILLSFIFQIPLFIYAISKYRRNHN